MSMLLSSLPKSTTKKKRRLGQGHGSGRVKTSGRGTKGQKARSGIPLSFEGGGLPLIKRLPFLRGKGRNKQLYEKPVTINVSSLNQLPNGSIVDVATLVKHKLVEPAEAKVRGVKILGEGEITVSLTVKLPLSKSAREKVEHAKGTVEVS